MDITLQASLIEAAIAVGLGLFIGLEREHSAVTDAGERPQPAETAFGVRTFALLSLLGWISALFAALTPWVPAVAFLVVGGLVVASYLRWTADGPGLTTEVAALVTFAVGLLVHWHQLLAVALGLATTLLLISKPWIRQLVPRLRRVELTSTLQLLILFAIVLPLLPTRASDPWGVLAPRRIGLFVILIASLSYVGYVLNRLLGQRRGAGVTGLVGGLASSTAVTAAMAQEARASDAMRLPAQLATFLANTVMFGRILVLTALISPEVTAAVAPSIGAMGVVMLAAALWKWRQARGSAVADEQAPVKVELKNPLALVPALKWGLVFSGILVLTAVAKDVVGDRGLLATAAASGLVDVDAITLAVSRQAFDRTLAVDVARLAVVIAAVMNTVFKGGLSWFTGGRRFGADVVKVFGVAIVIGVASAIAL